MFSAALKFLRDCFTEADNQTWDLGRVAWAGLVAGFLGLAFWNHSKFDPQQFGIGAATLLGAGGLMIWSKDKEKTAGDHG